MAIMGISPAETIDYISTEDPARSEAEGATVFVLGMLDPDIHAWIVDHTSVMENGAEGQVFRGVREQRALLATRYGLKGWRGFKEPGGADAKFEQGHAHRFGRDYRPVSDACMSTLPSDLIRELGERILALNSVTRTQAKN